MKLFNDNRQIPSSFLDIILNFAIVLLMSLGLIIILINDPKEQEQKNQDPIGKIMVEMLWDDNENIDIDLWTKYGDAQSVGYSRKSGFLFDLLRDDVGKSVNDISGRNYEIQVGKDIKPGRYIVNIVWFAGTTENTPLTVKVAVSLVRKGESARVVLSRDVQIMPYQERNVFVFYIDEHTLNLDKNSVYSDDNISIGTRNGISGGPVQ